MWRIHRDDRIHQFERLEQREHSSAWPVHCGAHRSSLLARAIPSIIDTLVFRGLDGQAIRVFESQD